MRKKPYILSITEYSIVLKAHKLTSKTYIMINYIYKLILYTHLVVIQKLLYIKGVEMVVQIRNRIIS